MKKQLLLISLSAAALAVSADSIAMMRRAPVRTATPRVQRAPQRSFGFKRNPEIKLQKTIAQITTEGFPMPYMPKDKVDVNVLARHNQLARELAKEKIEISSLKAEKRSHYYWLPVVVLTNEVFFLLWAAANPSVYLNRQIAECVKNEKTVQAELEDLVAEQERQLRIPEDIQ